MAALSEDVKLFIVQALACYDTPSQVAEAVKEEFGVLIVRQQVATYDPTKHTGKNVSKKWRAVFDATREKFKAEVADIPIANRAFRLRTLQRMVTKAEGMKNMALTAQLLEQAAKEVGDAYVNRRLDAPKAPGEGDIPAAPEYRLSPDENVPDAPIL